MNIGSFRRQADALQRQAEKHAIRYGGAGRITQILLAPIDEDTGESVPREWYCLCVGYGAGALALDTPCPKCGKTSPPPEVPQ